MLGLLDIDCTVQGGGTTVGAIQLEVSRALQNWEPHWRPALKEPGFLTRDLRVVERKKPEKAKARKSCQWINVDKLLRAWFSAQFCFGISCIIYCNCLLRSSHMPLHGISSVALK